MGLYLKTKKDKLKKGLLLLGLCILAYTCNKGDDNSPPTPQKYTISIIASEGGNVNTSGGEFIDMSGVYDYDGLSRVRKEAEVVSIGPVKITGVYFYQPDRKRYWH